MKRVYLYVAVISILAFAAAGCKGSDTKDTALTEQVVSAENNSEATAAPAADAEKETVTTAPVQATTETADTYKDGVYEVKTEPDYEKYYTEATVTIEGGKIISVDWTIYDGGHEDKPFDEEYYKVMEPYGDLYVQQAKEDWTGSRDYDDSLIETQDVSKVDAVSGATWTNKKFKEIVKLALEQAKN